MFLQGIFYKLYPLQIINGSIIKFKNLKRWIDHQTLDSDVGCSGCLDILLMQGCAIITMCLNKRKYIIFNRIFTTIFTMEIFYMNKCNIVFKDFITRLIVRIYNLCISGSWDERESWSSS
jgi:hypothetical protein